MYFVNPEDVMRLFKDYVESYNGLISKEIAYEELESALDSAEAVWIDKGGEAVEKMAKVSAG